MPLPAKVDTMQPQPICHFNGRSLRSAIHHPAARFRFSSLLAAILMAWTSNIPAQPAAPELEFLAPTNGAVYSTRDEIPIVLRSVAPNDLIVAADVSTPGEFIGTAVFCCPFCPCAHPVEGQELILQIPVPWDNGHPPARTWQGWTNLPAGIHYLTARAVSQNGTPVEAKPVIVTIIDLTLHILVRPDRAVGLVIPQGSLTNGHFDAEASEDLHTWTRLGSFSPGNVAAFFEDEQPASAFAQRYYRSVYVPATERR